MWSQYLIVLWIFFGHIRRNIFTVRFEIEINIVCILFSHTPVCESQSFSDCKITSPENNISSFFHHFLFTVPHRFANFFSFCHFFLSYGYLYTCALSLIYIVIAVCDFVLIFVFSIIYSFRIWNKVYALCFTALLLSIIELLSIYTPSSFHH